MRKSIASVALIVRRQTESEWLLQWNAAWNCFNLIGGHKREDESFRDCLIREIDEELHLHVARDYRIAAKPQLELGYLAFSKRAQCETQYEVLVYPVDLEVSAERQAMLEQAEENNRWVSESEIDSGKTRDGATISDMTARVLRAVRAQREGNSHVV